MIELDWYGCYGPGWKGEITPESFTHPAKFSRKLIRRIYEFLLTSGLLETGDTVLDPFGGIALGAADALKHGVNWVGIELEQKFVDCGAGCDCTGISKEDWVRFYGRLGRANYKQGRHWCPRCVAQAEKIVEPATRQMSLFELAQVSTTSYTRNSGKIPSVAAHRYDGNVARFHKVAQGGATATLLQGDSRKLLDVLGRAFEGVISSPPFAGNSGGRGEASRNGIDAGLFDRHQGAMVGGIGDKDKGNLASMQAKEADLKVVISSPPYGEGCSHTGGKINASYVAGAGSLGVGFDGVEVAPRYGQAEGQLGGMGSGDINAIVTSSPYVESLGSDEPKKRGGLFRDPKRGTDKSLTATYGKTEGQLGGMGAGDGPDGVISSPPYENSNQDYQKGWETIDRSKADRTRTGVNQTATYGKTEGQLGGMGAGDGPDGVISSPPYENSNQDYQAGWETIDRSKLVHNRPTVNQTATYGQTEGQLSQANGDTFWGAARLIVEQCRLALEPKDGTAVFVTKNFVKAGKRVPFTKQWIQLCEACGFELIVHARAWLVEERKGQQDFNGDVEIKKVQHKSFFRLLAEKKGSPSIDWEDVLMFRIARKAKGEFNV